MLLPKVRVLFISKLQTYFYLDQRHFMNIDNIILYCLSFEELIISDS